jgi:hypothetical protein
MRPGKDPTQAKGTWLAGIGVALFLLINLMIIRQLVLAAPADREPVILLLCLQVLLAGCFCTAFWRSRVVAPDALRYPALASLRTARCRWLTDACPDRDQAVLKMVAPSRTGRQKKLWPGEGGDDASGKNALPLLSPGQSFFWNFRLPTLLLS